MLHKEQVNRDSSQGAPPTCCPITDCRSVVWFNSCCLSTSCFSAHSWQKCFSFFLPLTISVKCTVAFWPQAWHFTFTRRSLLHTPYPYSPPFMAGFSRPPYGAGDMNAMPPPAF